MKKGTKIILGIIIACAVIFFGSAIVAGIYQGIKGNGSTIVKEEQQTITDIKEEKVMNGTGDKEIGKRGIATYDKDKTTEEEIVKFYNEHIKDSGYNYYTLIDKNNNSYGIEFISSGEFGEIGKIDDTRVISQKEKSFTIKDNKIVWD